MTCVVACSNTTLASSPIAKKKMFENTFNSTSAWAKGGGGKTKKLESLTPSRINDPLFK